MLTTSLFVFAFCLKGSQSTTGIDLSTSCDEFTCMKSDGIEFTITRAWVSYGAFDSSSITNLDNAKNAGIEYNDVYMFPCRGDDAKTQVDDMINDLKSSGQWGPSLTKQEKIQLDKTKHEREERYRIAKKRNGNNYIPKGLQAGYTQKEKQLIAKDGKLNKNIIKTRNRQNNLNETIIKQNNGKIPKWRQDAIDATYGMIWFDIEYNPSSACSWAKYSSTDNCEYLGELISAGKDAGASVGVYSSEYEWETVMGSSGACTDYTSYPVWYAHYDDDPSFSDFSEVSFGGWTTPSIKQYEGDATLCSSDVDMNYY